ncbi:transporter, putative [Plasmodium gallinaceum]|uniref:Transporter, putative n=1 Tax=Plasmodium gallinaceum TaxID=5849 RepID=A0A1J1H033_PLAGA|nr:transporter, putative [Plasmodium gallinaceum]CRG96636.1 transporter, putative [Plasmodium gallinaceum]
MKNVINENIIENLNIYDHSINKTINDKVDVKKLKKIEINENNLHNYLSKNNMVNESKYNLDSYNEKKNMNKKDIIVIENNVNNEDYYNTNEKNKEKKETNYNSESSVKNKKILKDFDIFVDKKNAINSIISSAFAGIMSRTITAPLDRVKYIMQITNNLPISEIFKIIKKDGIFCGFFRGNCVNIVKIIPELSIKMYSYEFMKLNVYNYYNKTNNCVSNEENINIPFFIRFLIGSSSGVIAALFIYPLEIVKTRLIVSNKNDDNGIIKCFYNIYKNERCRNFYNGLSMHIYGVLFFSGCNMSIYDYLKYLFFSFYKDYIHSNYCLKNVYKKGNDFFSDTNNKNNNYFHIYNNNNNNNNGKNFLLKTVSNSDNIKKDSEHKWNNKNYQNKGEDIMNKISCSYCDYRIKNVNCLSFLFFGITSSFIAQIVSYPFLVLRTRMQTLNNEIASNYLNNERKKIKSCSFILYNIKKYGFKSLYRGIYVNLLKTIPATSITWFSYEFSMRKLQNN